jgi:hypothetical protein
MLLCHKVAQFSGLLTLAAGFKQAGLQELVHRFLLDQLT